MLKISELFEDYEKDFHSNMSKIATNLNLDLNQCSHFLSEANKCLRQMESELFTLPYNSRKSLQIKICEHQKRFQQAKQQVQMECDKKEQNDIELSIRRKSSPGNNIQRQRDSLNDNYAELAETDSLIEGIHHTVGETYDLANYANQTLGGGTLSLHNSLTSSQTLNSHLKRMDVSITIMNRTLMMDKCSLYLIILLLGVIDFLALYMKLN